MRAAEPCVSGTATAATATAGWLRRRDSVAAAALFARAGVGSAGLFSRDSVGLAGLFARDSVGDALADGGLFARDSVGDALADGGLVQVVEISGVQLDRDALEQASEEILRGRVLHLCLGRCCVWRPAAVTNQWTRLIKCCACGHTRRVSPTCYTNQWAYTSCITHVLHKPVDKVDQVLRMWAYTSCIVYVVGAVSGAL